MHTDSFNEIVDQVISHGVRKGILHLYSENESFVGNSIILKGKSVINFGSCSYLGLEHDQRLKKGAQNAIQQYGTQFSSSRAYLSLGLYENLECLFENIFDAYCIVTPTTTLGHLANLPVLVGNKDAVIIDQQVHSSVQMAVSLLKAKGIYTEIIRHNRMDLLEQRINHLHNKHTSVWYLADGIYSMYGDGCHVQELYDLMNKYERFCCYIDDAHGMSIYGENGRGYVLNKRNIHSKMILAASLAKAFATGGAVMVYPDKEIARKVRTCGGTLITSGPLQPANLGAAIACAGIHLSPEIYSLQKELHEKIKFACGLLKEFELPVISASNASVFFVGVTLPKLGYNLVNRMLTKGYYLNLGVFPAVPMKNTGIRFTITRLHTHEQIYDMVKTLAAEFPKALSDEGMTITQVHKAFKMLPPKKLSETHYENSIRRESSLQILHYNTICDIDAYEWNNIFRNRGTFDWNGMQVLENSFAKNDAPEHNWLFDYIFIKDADDKVVVATFLTTTIWKDDMLSPAPVSAYIERTRADDPYYLTSRIISTGSLLTEGEHLFINKNSAQWKDAMLLLLQKIHELQEKYKANNIVIRDFQEHDDEIDILFTDNDFVKIQMPGTNIIENISFKTQEAFYENLSKRSKQHFREDIRKHINKFSVSIVQNPTNKEISNWYGLYLNVKQNNLELNTFTLPKKLFNEFSKNENWETIVLRLKPPHNSSSEEAVCIVWCYKTDATYIPMIIGIDYTYNGIYKIYRQALFRIALRAAELNKQKIYFGFSASVEKKKLGARQVSTHAYIQYKDGYNLETLAGLNINNQNEKILSASKV